MAHMAHSYSEGLVGSAVSPGPGDSKQWSQWPQQDRAQTQSVLTTQCLPPSSCAMSSLLLLAQAAEALGQEPASALASGGRRSLPHQGLPVFLAGPADAQSGPPVSNKSLNLHGACIYLAMVLFPLRGITPPPAPSRLSSEAKTLPQPTSTPRPYPTLAATPGGRGGLSFLLCSTDLPRPH